MLDAPILVAFVKLFGGMAIGQRIVLSFSLHSLMRVMGSAKAVV